MICLVLKSQRPSQSPISNIMRRVLSARGGGAFDLERFQSEEVEYRRRSIPKEFYLFSSII